MNSISLVGRLTRTPELKETTSGHSVCNFDLAVNRDYKKDENSQSADFIRCQIWDKQAENLVKYQDKGSLIALEGVLRVDNYKDNEGNNRSITYVRANKIDYLEKREIQQEEPVEEYPTDQTGEEITQSDEEIEEVEVSQQELPF